MEPTACVVHGVCELITIARGDVVLVTGPGAIGLTALQVAKAAGARVIVSGTAEDRERLDLAAASARTRRRSRRHRAGRRGLHRRRGRGRRGRVRGQRPRRAGRDRCPAQQGRYLQLGLLGHEMQIAFDVVLYKELAVTGSISSRDVSWRRAIAMVERGEVRPGALVSSVFPLEDWKAAFAMHAGRKGLKILFGRAAREEECEAAWVNGTTSSGSSRRRPRRGGTTRRSRRDRAGPRERRRRRHDQPRPAATATGEPQGRWREGIAQPSTAPENPGAKAEALMRIVVTEAARRSSRPGGARRGRRDTCAPR